MAAHAPKDMARDVNLVLGQKSIRPPRAGAAPVLPRVPGLSAGLPGQVFVFVVVFLPTAALVYWLLKHIW